MTVRPRDDVALMAGYHSPQVQVRVRLNTNESPEPPPAAWEAELATAMAGIDWHRYPDREAGELRRAIGELHDVEPGLVFAANGSNEVLQTVLLTYGGAGRTVAAWAPTYALHTHIARLTGAEVVEGERAPDFTLDLAEVARVLDGHRPSVAFLCSPNNPTGLVEPREVVAEVLARTSAIDCLLVVDEAYGQFAPWSAVELVAEDVPLVVTRTFSKTWSMAAARLGYLVGPRHVVEDLHKVVLPYHLDAAKQLAGRLALHYRDEMEARVERLVAERRRLETALAQLPVEVWPSGANFVLFRPRRPDGSPGGSARGDEVWQGLLDRSVLVRNCSSWPRLAGCLRVTIGTPAEDDIFLDALREILT